MDGCIAFCMLELLPNITTWDEGPDLFVLRQFARSDILEKQTCDLEA